VSYFNTTFSAFFTLEVLKNPQGVAQAPAPAMVTWDATNHAAGAVISNGGLTVTIPQNIGSFPKAIASPFQSTGKRVYELSAIAATIDMQLGICTQSLDGTETTSYAGQDANSWAYLPFDGTTYHNDVSGPVTGPTYTDGDVVTVAVDFDAGKMWFGTAAGGYAGNPGAGTGEAFTFTPHTPLSPLVLVSTFSGDPAAVVTLNAGGSAFAAALPAGFTAWQA
jgi:hypothetical protein